MNILNPIRVKASKSALYFAESELHNVSRLDGLTASAIHETRDGLRGRASQRHVVANTVEEAARIMADFRYYAEKNRGGFADCTGGRTPSLANAADAIRADLEQQGYIVREGMFGYSYEILDSSGDTVAHSEDHR